MKKSFKKWISTSGRANRSEFIIISVISLIAFVLITALFMRIFQSFHDEHIQNFYTRDYVEKSIYFAIIELSATGTLDKTANTLYQDLEGSTFQNMIRASFTYLLFLPFVICWIAGAVRRLHDIGTFGWWVLFILAPIWLFFDNWVIMIPLLFLFFKKGQDFHNKYGPPPHNPNTPITLEMPKESEKLAKFESNVLKVVDNIKLILKPYWDLLLSKIKK
ncbi:hypothetical protein A4G16_00855 [Mannheimia granulomatis]|uniref:DUF805 domain-containing protein n=1 Tax=Mannheimia granulomatis TaxID=85402 RepID=A0A6G8JGB9_9PAST|nr:DUF805 domain-containing protein [Mannheimia granulomatis]QIM66023.1 hypothetical protein A4G16_00855 [Mannheimia granulomatis]